MFFFVFQGDHRSIEQGFEIGAVIVLREPRGTVGKYLGVDPALGEGDLVGAAGLQYSS
jgi:hypothetical protein